MSCRVVINDQSKFSFSAPRDAKVMQGETMLRLPKLAVGDGIPTVFGCVTLRPDTNLSRMTSEEFYKTQEYLSSLRSVIDNAQSFDGLNPVNISICLLVPNNRDYEVIQTGLGPDQIITQIIHAFMRRPEDGKINTMATLQETVFFIKILLQRLSSNDEAKAYFRHYCEVYPFPDNHLETINNKATLAQHDTCCLKLEDYYSSKPNSDTCNDCIRKRNDHYRLKCAAALMEESLKLGMRA